MEDTGLILDSAIFGSVPPNRTPSSQDQDPAYLDFCGLLSIPELLFLNQKKSEFIRQRTRTSHH